MNNEKKLDQQLEAEFSEDMLDLKSKLKRITAGQGEAKKVKVLRFVLPIIAVASGLAIAIMFLPQLFQSTSSEGLYSSYYEPYPMVLNQRGAENTEVDDAIIAYNNGQYAEASVLFKNLFDQTGEAVYLLYHGSAEQALGNLAQAIEVYDQVVNLQDERLTEQAGWYKVLALIKLDKKKDANELIKAFKESHYKYREAQRILDQNVR